MSETEFIDCADKYGHVESAVKFLYILGHTDNDKHKPQHLEQQIWLMQFQKV